MKLIKTASGKKKLKMSRKEWTSIGKKAGWMRTSQTEATKIFYEKTILDNADDLKEAIQGKRYKVAKVCLDEIMNALYRLIADEGLPGEIFPGFQDTGPR